MTRSSCVLFAVATSVSALVLAAEPRIAAQQASGGAGRPPASGAPQAPQGSPNRTPINHTEGTGAISGVITDGKTHRPIAGALVYLGIQNYGPVGRTSRQITDPKGRFVFTNLPAADTFFLNASKAGYNEGHYGDTGPVTSGVASGLIRLTTGQWFPQANIPLWRPGVIAGTVVDEHGDPEVGVRVRVLSRVVIAGASHLAAGATTLTDDRGRYRLSGLSAGTYVVNVPSVQNAVPAATSPMEIEGQTPAAAANASSDTPSRNGGALPLDSSHLLIIGNYATPPLADGRPQAYPMAFHPGVSSVSEATPIVLDSSETREDVNVILRPTAAARVSGHVDGTRDAVRGLVLRLIAPGLEDLGDGSEVATSLVDPNGDFTFLNVPPGQYSLEGSRSRLEFSSGPSPTSAASMPGTPGQVQGPGTIMASVFAGPPGTRLLGSHTTGDAGYWTRTAVTVGAADVAGLVVQLHRAVSLHGRIAFDGTGAPPGPTLIMVEPADGRSSLGVQQSTSRPDIGDDDTFTINGLGAGEYVIRILGLSPRQAVESITATNADYTTRPFDAGAGQDFNDVVITFTDRIASLGGSVQLESRGDQRLMTVIAFPASRDQWTRYGFQPTRFKTVPVSNAGTYQIDNLPAGSYLLVAVESSQAKRWQDASFLDAASQVATRVTIGWGDHKSQDLRMVTIK